ncbi:MAG: FAD-binding and (Fe-S)-binding domain-containing protein [Nocardioidaceae bacterium]
MTADVVPDLVAELRRAGVADVDDSPLARALFSADASLYRVVPQVVARPRHRDELLAVLEVARSTGTPVTMRGAGTSIAGNAVGPGIVVDCVRHLGRVLSVAPEERRAVVEPGVVHATLQAAAAPHGLRYGPDPSTHTRCTIGGMIGNNACGSRALGYGRTVDTVAGLVVAFGTGEVATLAAGAGGPGTGSRAGDALVDLVGSHLGDVRTSCGRFSRQGSGYALEHLLPERERRVDRFLVGSEGTLGLVLEATVDLVDEPAESRLLLLGYPSMADAADAVPALLAAAAGQEWRLVACEGLDARLVEPVRRAGWAVPDLPRGGGWLFAEVTSGSGPACEAGAARLVAVAGAVGDRLVDDPGEAAALWRIRESGAGIASRSLDRPAHSGWEDAAVPPEHLGAWLREFDELLTGHGLHTVPYGHFGDGCLHARIDFAFDEPGRRVFRQFLVACATALRAYGGSISGEHGDGRARSELLPLMYDDATLALFGAAKAVCDPDGLLNPGVLVDPAPLDADLRPGRPRYEPPLALRFPQDGGSLAEAVHRCTGVGLCVAPRPAAVMCPSFAATREEKDSTRGRARVLQEAVDGTLVHGLGDPAVQEALDLCLACKGCSRDCPTGVDLATWKAEVLQQAYAHRRRPRSHYTLGRLPRWVRLVGSRGALANRLLRGPLRRVAASLAGVDPRRSLPALAPVPLRASSAVVDRTTAAHGVPDVWVWGDTFTDAFRPETAHAAISVLAAAGVTARVIPEHACCGLTWTTTGQLDAARRVAGRAVATLAPYVESGTPVLGLEPSCLAALRGDLDQLVDDPRAEVVARGVLTLAELLERLDWPPPDLTGVEIVAQPHCHHASVLGWAADERLLRRAGADLTVVGGCCGLAGSWGMEPGHADLSRAVAETQLLPAVRAHPHAVVLADGLSCRHQLADLEGVAALTLAELLASRLPR